MKNDAYIKAINSLENPINKIKKIFEDLDNTSKQRVYDLLIEELEEFKPSTVKPLNDVAKPKVSQFN